MAFGFDSTALVQNAIKRRAQGIIEKDNVLFTVFPSLFRVGEQTSGLKHVFGIQRYTSNATAMGSFADAAPVPDTTTGVQGEIEKTPFQASLLLYTVLKAMTSKGSGNQVENAVGTAVGNSVEIEAAAIGLRNEISSTVIGQLEAQVDMDGTVYDNALSRTVYDLQSKELKASDAVLTPEMLDEVIDYELSKSGGAASRNDLVFIMPPKQHRKVANFSTGTVGTDLYLSNVPMWASSENKGNIDAGRAYRVNSYDNIPIVVCDDMNAANVLCLNKNTITLLPWNGVELTDKSQSIAALQEMMILWAGYDIACEDPKRNSKISGLG